MHKVSNHVTEALRPEGSPRTFAGALSEEKALKQVTEFLGEAVVFGVRRHTRTARQTDTHAPPGKPKPWFPVRPTVCVAGAYLGGVACVGVQISSCWFPSYCCNFCLTRSLVPW